MVSDGREFPTTLGALWHHGKAGPSPTEHKMRPHKTMRGHIHYTSSKPGREGVERGREFFTITVHGDGRRTLRAHNLRLRDALRLLATLDQSSTEAPDGAVAREALRATFDGTRQSKVIRDTGLFPS